MIAIAIIGLRLPDQEKALLAIKADRSGTTISDIVRTLIRVYLGRVSPKGETAPSVPAPTQALGWHREQQIKERFEL